MNLADGLRINSWRYPDKTAAVFEERRLTYSELNARANCLAHGLIKRGFKRGDKVSIILYNCIEFLEIYHAFARIGVISVPINFRLVPNERDYIINNSESKALFIGPEFIKDFDAGRAPSVADNCYVVGVIGEKSVGLQNYEDILAGMPEHEPFVEQSEEDLFYLGYTSGTTGFPKGAMIQTRGTLEVIKNALVRNANREGLDLTQRVFLAIMPICHSNSIWATLITYWFGGINVIFPSGRFEPEKVLKTIDCHKVTTTSMVPTMITRILELPEEIKDKYNMDSLTSVGSSSAPLLTKTKEAALKFFSKARFSEGYGSTETGALTTLRHKDQMRKVRSIGKPNPGIEIRLIDENQQVVTKPNEVGVLWAKAPSAFIGYYQDLEKTREAINGVWSTAGDMAYFDEEGYYFLVDRKHDMIISGGENVYPAEIEEVVMKHPAISEVAAIGVPHEQWGEVVKVLVILKEGAQATEEEILTYCKQHLAGYKTPRSIEFRDDFPRTATGKILKRIVKKPYWEGQERMI